MPSSKYPQFTQVSVLRKIFLWLFSCFLSDLTVSSCPSVYWFKHMLSLIASIRLSICLSVHFPDGRSSLPAFFASLSVFFPWNKSIYSGGHLQQTTMKRNSAVHDKLRWFYLRKVGIVSRFWACLVWGWLIAASSWIRQKKKCSNKHPAG